MTTFAGVLLRRRDDDHVGLRTVEDDAGWRWSEVVQEAAVRAALLQDLRRDGPFHVGVLLENVPDFVFLLGAAALSGATVVGINPTRRGAALAEDIRHTDCQLVVTEDRQAPLLDGLDLGLPPDRIVTVESGRWAELLAAHVGSAPPPDDELPAASDLLLLLFTSGSSGVPKAVRATQGRMAVAADGMPFQPRDVLYCAMPLFHGNALISNLLPAIGSGATVVLRRRFSAAAFLPDVRRYGVTYVNSVGRALSYVLATPPTPADRDHQVKLALAPESSARDMADFQARFGIPVIEGYGSSEGGLRLLPVPDAPRPGVLGRPEPEVDVVVVDAETGRERPRARFDSEGRLLNGSEAIGELVRRNPGPGGFEGYYNNPEATAARRRNGWFWSGDLAYRDEEGLFYFAGRTIDWLRVDGENFAAAPVERILSRHPDLAAVAVYSVPDPRTGDQVMAALELRAGGAESFDPEGFAAFLAAQDDLGPKWWPRLVRVMPALPDTATNKVAKQQLREVAWLTDDPVWWRPTTRGPYVRLRPDDVAALAAAFATHGRDALLPRL